MNLFFLFFLDGIYNLKEKIKKIDSSKIFILPSKSEGMPQGLIEAMAREKIVLASNNQGSRELIQENKTGFLFEVGNSKDLIEKINFILEKNNKDKVQKVGKNTKKSVERFRWSNIVKKIEELF